METDERSAVVGRALERLVALAWTDDDLRTGLRALAQFVRTLDQVATTSAEASPQADDVPVAGEDLVSRAAQAETTGDISTISEAPGVGPAETEAGLEGVLPQPSDEVSSRGARETVPMAPGALRALIEEAMRGLSQGAPALAEHEASPALEFASSELALDRVDSDEAVLHGLVTRARLRAAVTDALAQGQHSGVGLDEELVHRARSEGCSLWMVDLLEPPTDALEDLAESLDALADAAEMLVLLDRYEPANRPRRMQAVRDLAAIQSALRIATLKLRQTADEDQLAAFRWLKDVTAQERIFVDRHMRLDDPLDPAQLAVVVEPIQVELALLKERAERDARLKRELQVLGYLAKRIESGKATARESEKLVETVETLVGLGVPPSSLDFRDRLLRSLAGLPAPEPCPTGYKRVLQELRAHTARIEDAQPSGSSGDPDEEGWPQDATASSIGCPSEAVRLARESLPMIVIPNSATGSIDEIDTSPESPAWGRSTWRALRALNEYAIRADQSSGFWDWCANSGHEFAWPANSKKLAMSESDTALGAFEKDRLFKVDLLVNPDGQVVMEAHLKISEGGGSLTPRIYFFDDTKGATERVHIGFIGPHKYVRNGSTN